LSAPGDALPVAAASERNKGPILEVLRTLLSASGRVLEIASGTGQHVAHFAAALPALAWQPTDADAALLPVIRTRVAAAGLGNVAAPLALDVHAEPWPVAGPFAAVVCINMIHIAPASATAALLGGAARVLAPGGLAFLYGPFREGSAHTAPSNAEFDASLKARNPEWGVRNLEDVDALAVGHGFVRTALLRMPANNLSVAWTRR
jgi:SAM-dependent methyltransferase